MKQEAFESWNAAKLKSAGEDGDGEAKRALFEIEEVWANQEKHAFVCKLRGGCAGEVLGPESLSVVCWGCSAKYTYTEDLP